MENDHFFPIGKIVGVHGVKGVIKVYPYSESLSFFKQDGLLLVGNGKGFFGENHTIAWAKPHKKIILLSLNDISTRSLAKKLVGSELFIEKTKIPLLEEGVYYWSDIIGLFVFTKDDKYLGIVESIISTGSNDVYVVKKSDDGKKGVEVLIPALESVVIKIDLKQKTMKVDLPEGL